MPSEERELYKLRQSGWTGDTAGDGRLLTGCAGSIPCLTVSRLKRMRLVAVLNPGRIFLFDEVWEVVNRSGDLISVPTQAAVRSSQSSQTP